MHRPPPVAANPAHALRRHLRRHRHNLPRALRVSLALGATIVAAGAMLIAVVAVTRPPLGLRLLQFVGVTQLAGREAALYSVFHGNPPLPTWLGFAFGTLDDMATLLLAMPMLWLSLERLRRIHLLDGMLRSLDRAFAARRRTIDRWGVFALAAFIWLPGIGTGPLLASGMGILARIPLRRLVPGLVVSVIAVNGFWVLAVQGTADVTPNGGLWDWLPALIILLLFCAGAISAVRKRRERFVFSYLLPAGTDAVFRGLLARKGFHGHEGYVEVDARQVAPALGLDPQHLAACHWACELLLLPSMEPREAGALARLGVTGVRDLAVLPPSLVCQALGEPELVTRAAVWSRDALEWVALST